ncbi:hypothetical protein H1P_70034 [Hyella patelloides LEGE 07179]|uniref:Uncharacterized protein n=1 Tax=Hyella patelloides LEGE 07179 TaxID=945734 RepID=A0A563W384_9CYAN|nr:hypothetical protein H1P_70034 [Hyella patelloides LEGE 07179]
MKTRTPSGDGNDIIKHNIFNNTIKNFENTYPVRGWKPYDNLVLRWNFTYNHL